MLQGRLRSWLVELIQSKEDTPHSEDEFDELDPNDPASWQSLDYIHDQVQTQLNVQSGIWDAVDGRLRLILGVITIVFAAAGALFQRSSWQAGGAPLPFSVGAATIVAVLLFLGAAAMVAWAYRPTDFDRPPKPGELRDLYLTTDPRRVKLTVIDSILDAYTGNEAVIKRKNRAFKWAFSLTAAGTGLLGLALMTQITCETSAPPWHALTWWAWPLGASGC
jgi:hypothetical protein